MNKTQQLNKEERECIECGNKIPENRGETCSDKCHKIYKKNLFEFMEEASNKLPKAKLHL